MSEIEIHPESEHAIDPAGQKVGVLAAVLAVMLAVVTIASYHSHTDAIDFGEGLLEMGLVLSSLCFISRKKMFPAMGAGAGTAGIAIAAAGLMV
jgi:hypothetical protein